MIVELHVAGSGTTIEYPARSQSREPMTTVPSSKRSGPHLRARLYRTTVAIGVLALGITLFLLIGNGMITWRVGVNVLDATLTSPDRLRLTVSSCNRQAEVSQLRETDVDVQVKVNAYIYPFRGTLKKCVNRTGSVASL